MAICLLACDTKPAETTKNTPERDPAFVGAGDSTADYLRGLQFLSGSPQDFAEAMKWFKNAADRGDGAALLMIGNMYFNGMGTPQDFVEAHKFYNLSAARGSVSDPSAVSSAAHNRSEVESKMTHEQISKAQGLASAEMSFNGPAPPGSLNDANGSMARGHYVTAFLLFRDLANAGNPSAQSKLGVLYDHGKGVPQNFAEANGWYRKAAEGGVDEAQLNLGLMYKAGRGLPRDHAEAASWLRKAANRGNPDAQYLLGEMYSKGDGVSKDFVQSHLWFNLAAARFLASEPAVEELFGKMQNRRDKAVGYREAISKEMTNQQLADAQKLAREWQQIR